MQRITASYRSYLNAEYIRELMHAPSGVIMSSIHKIRIACCSKGVVVTTIVSASLKVLFYSFVDIRPYIPSNWIIRLINF